MKSRNSSFKFYPGYFPAPRLYRKRIGARHSLTGCCSAKWRWGNENIFNH